MSEFPPFATGKRAFRISVIADDLNAVEQIIQRQLRTADPFLQPASIHLLRSAGKRLRPAAFLLMVRMVGETPSVPHFVTAAVLELCHTASLIHDDVLDNASVRRGRPALHKISGNREAILFGDYLLAGAFHLLAELFRPDLVSVMAELVTEVCGGEIRQWAEAGLSTTEESYLAVVEAKTASFFRCAGTLTGKLTSLGNSATEKLEEWGRSFGTAYQIFDDLYDLVSPPYADKSTGLDARVGILTLPWIKLREKHGLEALRRSYIRYRTEKGANVKRDPSLREGMRLSADKALESLKNSAQALTFFPDTEAKKALLGVTRELEKKLLKLCKLF